MSKNLFKNQIENLKLCADKILSVNKYFQNNELTPQDDEALLTSISDKVGEFNKFLNGIHTNISHKGTIRNETVGEHELDDSDNELASAIIEINDDDDDDDDDDCELLEAEISIISHDKTMQAKQECQDISEVVVEDKYLKVLKNYFGYSNFRPLQWRIINAAMNEKRDNCVVMATGYGKSLCYQFTSIYTDRITVVISPLISLMEDQVMGLKAANIEACFLGSAQNEMKLVKEELLLGKYRIVYMTPEFIIKSHAFLKSLNRSVGIDLLAIDEAHCVSQWGHDFRSAYRSLGTLRSQLEGVPIIAVTATATPVVINDICRSLKLRNPLITCSSYDRPNLYLSVQSKTSNAIGDLESQMITDAKGHKTFNGATIVYCQTKKSCDDITDILNTHGIVALQYHAGMDLILRKRVHRKFINDKIQVVVATMAFGMGIDKPDVRTIIHYGAPRDIESYYQEIGRAGRDGLDSQCHVIYSSNDFATSRYFLNSITDQTFFDHKNDMIVKMQDYLSIRDCRRKFILCHFNGSKDGISCSSKRCCDNCTERMNGGGDTAEVDYGDNAYKLFNAISETGQRFGLGVPVLFLRGSANKKLPLELHDNAQYGCGKDKTEIWWKAFGKHLIVKRYLEEKQIAGAFGTTLELSRKADQYLEKCRYQNSARPLLMMPSKELSLLDMPKPKVGDVVPIKKTLVLGNTDWLSNDTSQTGEGDTTTSKKTVTSRVALTLEQKQMQLNLYNELIAVRDTLSLQYDLLSYQIFNNKIISEMAKHRPTTPAALARIDDVPAQKADKYGKEFTAAIAKFCLLHDLGGSTGTEPTPTGAPGTAKISTTKILTQKDIDALNLSEIYAGLSVAIRTCYEKFQRNKQSLETIMSERERKIKLSSLEGYLHTAYRSGLPLDIDRIGISTSVVESVLKVIRSPAINSDVSRSADIKLLLPEDFEYSRLLLVLTHLKRTYGVDEEHILLQDEIRQVKRTAEELDWEIPQISKKSKNLNK